MENILGLLNIDNLIIFGGLILGILICLFGLKFHKLVLAIIGFVVGFALGNIVVDLFGVVDQSLALVLRIGFALVIGGFSFTLFESLLSIAAGVGIFIITSDIIGTMWYSYLIAIVLGLFCSYIIFKFYKLGVVLFSSIVGAYLVTNGIIGYLNYPYLLVFGVVFIIGVVFQLMTNNIKK